MFEEKNKPKKGSGFKWAWTLNTLGFFIFFLAQLLNAYRTEWLNVDHRSAGENFAFNIGTYIPLNLAATLLCVISLFCFFIAYKSAKRNNLPVTWADKLSIAPLIPVFMVVGLTVGWIGYLLLLSYIKPY